MEVKCSKEPPKKLSARLQTVSNEGKLMYFRRESFAIIRIKNLPVGLEDSILLCSLKKATDEQIGRRFYGKMYLLLYHHVTEDGDVREPWDRGQGRDIE